MSRSEWSNAKKGKGKGNHKSSKERRTPLFECEDEDGNNYILNINWNQGREDIEKKLEEKRKDLKIEKKGDGKGGERRKKFKMKEIWKERKKERKRKRNNA